MQKYADVAVPVEQRSFAAGDDGAVLIGNGAAMQQLRRDLEIVARSAGAVLICGESGTGKELVARSVHAASSRRQAQLVPVNCAAFPDSLMDAELFGHERGAFTGASCRREGRFEAAHGGTLFLDEIGELPPAAQAKLLRVLETGVYYRLGSSEPHYADVRIVSATHRDLEQLVREGRFREDLYYRIKVFRLDLPPLRDRREDVPALVDHFCRLYAPRGARPTLTPAAWAALSACELRGNVRELEHAVRHAIAFARGGEIGVEHLPAELRGSHASAARFSDGPAIAPLTLALTEFEHEYLLRTLERTDGNRSLAASLLGISRKSLWAKLKRYSEQVAG